MLQDIQKNKVYFMKFTTPWNVYKEYKKIGIKYLVEK